MKLLWFAAAATTLIWSNAALANTRICVSIQQKSWYKPGAWAGPPPPNAPAPPPNAPASPPNAPAPPPNAAPQPRRAPPPPQPGFEGVQQNEEMLPYGGPMGMKDPAPKDGTAPRPPASLPASM